MDRLPPQRAIQGVGAMVTLPGGAKIDEQVVRPRAWSGPETAKAARATLNNPCPNLRIRHAEHDNRTFRIRSILLLSKPRIKNWLN